MNEYMKRIEKMANYVDGAPDIDVADVIRCKDCHRRWHDGYCPIMKKTKHDAGFCDEAVTEEEMKDLLKERADRPYDAMGDDQGRGDAGDPWYRENFVDADAYKR